MELRDRTDALKKKEKRKVSSKNAFEIKKNVHHGYGRHNLAREELIWDKWNHDDE